MFPVHLIKDSFHCRDQLRDALSDYIPDDVEVDIRIVVDDTMPHRLDAIPGDLGMRFFRHRRPKSTRFTDYLNEVHERECEKLVVLKIVTIST